MGACFMTVSLTGEDCPDLAAASATALLGPDSQRNGAIQAGADTVLTDL